MVLLVIEDSSVGFDIFPSITGVSESLTSTVGVYTSLGVTSGLQSLSLVGGSSITEAKKFFHIPSVTVVNIIQTLYCWFQRIKDCFCQPKLSDRGPNTLMIITSKIHVHGLYLMAHLLYHSRSKAL